jgi:hypothetical protein
MDKLRRNTRNFETPSLRISRWHCHSGLALPWSPGFASRSVVAIRRRAIAHRVERAAAAVLPPFGLAHLEVTLVLAIAGRRSTA